MQAGGNMENTRQASSCDWSWLINILCDPGRQWKAATNNRFAK